MPPVLIGKVFVLLGATAATGAAVTALVTAAYVGAAIGAVVGAATSLISGGNILKGALKGAALGFVSGGVLKGVGMAMGGAGSAGAGVGEAGLTGTEVAAGTGAGSEMTLGGGLSSSDLAQSPVQVLKAGGTGLPPQAAAAPAKEGLLGRAMDWVDKHPGGASVVGQGLGGAAKGMLESRTADKEIAALMERDRLNREAIQIKGLEDLDLRSPLPSIASFADRPKWQFPETGLIWGGKQNAKTATA